jgi:tRNA(fMet)-specific endonuclease VapC
MAATIPTYLLDTDHVTLLERGGTEGATIRSRLAPLFPGEVATTIISYEEQMRGWLAYVAQFHSVEKQVEPYHRLERGLRFFCAIPLVPFDERAVEVFQRIWLARPRIGTMDLKIAAIALANDATLLSRNLRDFQKVPDLRVEDWTT